MKVALIGAGPSGLAVARALQKVGMTPQGFELSHGVGGLWDITNPRSTVYESAHLISSRTTTEFTEFPMPSTIDYPGHRALLEYFNQYAERFGLTDYFSFRTKVTRLEPHPDGGWNVTSVRLTRAGNPAKNATTTEHFDYVVLANGVLAEPHRPEFAGAFAGTIMHTSEYKRATQLAGKHVLIIGAGNSGCDIAVDAVHHAASVDLSVRRGYYFIPRYMFGRPTDTFNQGKPLPRPLKQFLDKWILRAFTGNPERFGFPKPRYRIYESHPIVNTMILNHLGQGDLDIRSDVDRFDGHRVWFVDGSSGEYDLVLLATGYKLDYPFVDRHHLHWRGASPQLFLNVFPPSFNGLMVAGMVEASGLGWQGRYEQAELIAAYLAAVRDDPERAERFRNRVLREPWPDLTAGYRYLALDRMATYVERHTYRTTIRAETAALRAAVEEAA